MQEQQKKKRGRKPKENSPSKSYFLEEQENAIKLYKSNISTYDKNRIFKSIIDPALKKLIKGVMGRPEYQKLGATGVNVSQLQEDTYFHVLFQFEKFDPNRLGKSGDPVKAYSYFSTIAKNYILQFKKNHDRFIANHGTRVDETTLGDVLVSSSNKIGAFEDLKSSISQIVDYSLTNTKLSKQDKLVGESLKYMLENWHKIEFETKNEFVRILCSYCGLKPTVVARAMKKFKTLISEKGVLN